MTLPRRAQMTLGALTMVLLFGILGLAWWSWRHRPGCQPVARFPRVYAALVAAGLIIIAVGTAWRIDTAIQPTRLCSPPGGAQPVTHGNPFNASLLAQKAATWPETGIGLLYARESDARVCWSGSANYYVAVNAHNIVGARALTVGDIVLSPGFHDASKKRLGELISHEAGHRAQWAVGTAIGGPLAFPVAYAIDDFFFPGARNHFERQAGLEPGGYRHEGTGPVLGPIQFATLGALAAIIVVALLAARHRRTSTRSAADPGARKDRRMTGPLTPDE